MNRKQFIFVLIALAIIGGAGLVLLRQNRQSWGIHEAKVGEKLLPHFRPNDVAAVRIKGASELHIFQTNGLWRVREREDFPANYPQLKDLLIKIRDTKVVQSEQIGPSQLCRVDLDPDGPHQGTLLEFIDRQGKVFQSVRAGKMHLHNREESVPFGLHGLFDGRYVLLPNEPENVLLISDDLASILPDPSVWLSKDFFKIENVKFISLLSANSAESWELVRENESWPWTLVAPRPSEALDTKMASELVEMLRFLAFVDILPSPPPAPAETGFDKPIVMTILTFDNFAYTLKIASPPERKPEGNYYLTVAVSAKLSTQSSSESENAGEKEPRDAQFQDKLKRLRDKLGQESQLAAAHRIFAVEPQIIDPLIRTRSQLLGKSTIIGEQKAPSNGPLAEAGK